MSIQKKNDCLTLIFKLKISVFHTKITFLLFLIILNAFSYRSCCEKSENEWINWIRMS